MNNSLLLETAKLPDLAGIVSIYNSTIASRMVTADTEPVTLESRVEWFAAHHPESRPLWVARQAGQLIGWVSLQSFYGRPAYQGPAEISIYLDEQCRGKGIGKELLAYSIDRCPALEIQNLLGFIFAHNTPSLKLFLAGGFTEWAHLPDIAKIEQKKISLKILGRTIT